jgi:hypothetical protein
MAEIIKQTEAQKNAWEKETQLGADINNYNNQLLGIHDRACNEPPMPSTVHAFIENFGNLAEKVGQKTSAETMAEIDKKSRAGDERSVTLNQVGVYKEVYLGSKRKLEKKYENRGKLKRAFDFLIGLPLKPFGIETKLKKHAKYKKFMDNLNKYEKLKDEIVALDGVILYSQRELETIEAEIVKEKGTPEEDISREQAQLRIRTITEAERQKIAKIIPLNGIGKENRELWEIAEQKLQEEDKKIMAEFGGRIDALSNSRQATMSELSMYDLDNSQHTKKLYTLREKIYDYDIQLEAIKQKLIKYRSENPIFLFERILGIQSIPLLDRYGQVSSDRVRAML